MFNSWSLFIPTPEKHECSALLALCEKKPPVTYEILHKGLVLLKASPSHGVIMRIFSNMPVISPRSWSCISNIDLSSANTHVSRYVVSNYYPSILIKGPPISIKWLVWHQLLVAGSLSLTATEKTNLLWTIPLQKSQQSNSSRYLNLYLSSWYKGTNLQKCVYPELGENILENDDIFKANFAFPDLITTCGKIWGLLISRGLGLAWLTLHSWMPGKSSVTR